MSTESSSDYEAASEATEIEGEGELGFGQEHSLASELNGWREAVTRLINVDSCVLAYMSNCIRLEDIDYGAFLQHADKLERENAYFSAANPSGISGSHSLLSQHIAACKDERGHCSRNGPGRSMPRRSVLLLCTWNANEVWMPDHSRLWQHQIPTGMSVPVMITSKWRRGDKSLASHPSQVPATEPKMSDRECRRGKGNRPRSYQHPTSDSPLTHHRPRLRQPPPVPASKRRTFVPRREPWRSLMIALMDIVNGKNAASFPERVPGMNREHALLFDHAVISLEQYQGQDVKDKNVVLVKDAQVAMPCCFNTMSERARYHFEKSQENELVRSTKASSLTEGFDQHECLTTLKKYIPILAKNTVQKLEVKLIIDRGTIFEKYRDQERLPPSIEVEDKVLQILIIIC